MKELTGNLWDFETSGILVITTNGALDKQGLCVMGRGVAAQAKRKYPILPKLLGDRIKAGGNHVYMITRGLVTFPVKHHWSDTADPGLITRSLRELVALVDIMPPGTRVFLPRPGCGNGGLTWDVVRPLINHLPDEYFIVNR